MTCRDAAVLILVIPGESPALVMAQKADHLRTHAGEVVFPGGMVEPGESPLEAELRECHEELGIPQDAIQLTGSLTSRITRHDVRVTPFVGTLVREVEFQPDPQEIQAVFRVPLSSLEGLSGYRCGNLPIRGVTAEMIRELLE